MMLGSLSRFTVRRGDKILGSMGSKELVRRLKTTEIGFALRIMEEGSGRGLALGQHPVLSDVVSKAMRGAKNVKREANSFFCNWFIADGAKKYGPFTYLQMVQYLQLKRLKCDDIVYHPNYHVWRRVGELSLFRDENIKALHKFSNLRPMFIARKNPRMDYENKVLVFDENSFFNGAACSLSSQGIGVVFDKNTPFKVGSLLQVHINRNDGHGAVQAKCKVVSRQLQGQQEKLGLTFDHKVDSLREYVESAIPPM